MAVHDLRAEPARRFAVETASPNPDEECRYEHERGGVSAAIRRHFASTAYEGPRLAVDLSWVEAAYRRLGRGLGVDLVSGEGADQDAGRGAEPYTAQIFYAVKANPHPALLARLRELGACFDVASRGEIERCLALGIAPERLSFGNTIKREADIAFAYGAGVRLFAFDAAEELEKLARAAPGASAICRLILENSSADWPLSRKFGCAPEMAEQLLLRAKELGLRPSGLSFHVGSQMRDPEGWRGALDTAAAVWRGLAARGTVLEILNIGGGFPARYGEKTLSTLDYAARVRSMVAEAFGATTLRLIAEPGRGLVANAGAIEAEVLLVSRKSSDASVRWVYLDIGRFGGLAEVEGEAIRYRVLTARDGEPTGPCVLAGPTCDSADVLYERAPVELPLDLRAGDRVTLPAAGAYTTTYSAVWFNGIEPLRETVLEGDGF